jgi:hypothetical protein
MSHQQHQHYQANDKADDSQALYLRPITNVQGHDVESLNFSSATPDPLSVSRRSYDSYLDSDVDDDLVKTIHNRKRDTSGWSSLWSMAARRRRSPEQLHDEHKHGANNPLLATGAAVRRAKRRGCYNWCIFGGISGAGLLYALSAALTIPC